MDPIQMRLRDNSKEFEQAGDFCWDLRGGKRTLVIAIILRGIPPEQGLKPQCAGFWRSCRI